mgnify:CR=1 FL=1
MVSEKAKDLTQEYQRTRGHASRAGLTRSAENRAQSPPPLKIRHLQNSKGSTPSGRMKGQNYLKKIVKYRVLPRLATGDMADLELSPILLCIGGHDPTGGAGIQADAEAARAAGIHAATVITCLTAQNTAGIRGLWPQSPEQIETQCRLILADSRVKAIKLGLIGSSHLARWLCQFADEHPDLPLILDPVLASGAGQSVVDAALFNQIRAHLLSRCLLATPNLPEAQALSGAQAPEDCARRILASGCRWVLITGTHAETAEVINHLYGQDGSYQAWRWPRLPHNYHGSGCTLASAIAARLALGQALKPAVAEAQEFTWHSLQAATRTGRYQWTPDRLFRLEPPLGARGVPQPSMDPRTARHANAPIHRAGQETQTSTEPGPATPRPASLTHGDNPP